MSSENRKSFVKYQKVKEVLQPNLSLLNTQPIHIPQMTNGNNLNKTYDASYKIKDTLHSI